MADFVPSTIGLTPEIVALLERISRLQGTLSAIRRDVSEDFRMEQIAAIDAVHFSTKIEGNALSRDQVTQALGARPKKGGRDLHEVLNYARTRRLVRHWSEHKKQLNDSWILLHHAEVLKGIVKGRLRGNYREAQCVIRDSKSRAIIYLAPEWTDVPPLMKGLLTWLRKEFRGTSPLLLAAQFHYEFVTIHPFMDGNGRLARLLTNGILMSGGYDVERYAALEKQHELNRRAYYAAMNRLQAQTYYEIAPGQDIGSWVLYWLRCLEATYREARERLQAVPEPSHTPSRIKKAEQLLRRHEVLRAGEYADLTGLGRTQAVADLNELVEGKIAERTGGGRSTVYRLRKRITS